MTPTPDYVRLHRSGRSLSGRPIPDTGCPKSRLNRVGSLRPAVVVGVRRGLHPSGVSHDGQDTQEGCGPLGAESLHGVGVPTGARWRRGVKGRTRNLSAKDGVHQLNV